jgi:ABC-type transport system involved in multi-copper enzyme maturation permease subunit
MGVMPEQPIAGGTGLLRYRPWRGELRGPASSVWAIARVSVLMVLRRRLFWGLFALAALIFFLYFFGQFLTAFAEAATTTEQIPLSSGVTNVRVRPADLVKLFKEAWKMNGSADTYANFIWFEGYTVMILLSFAGSVLVGADFQNGSLAFYLSKPLHRWHYVAGKGLAVALLVNLVTTVPAIVLFVEYGLLDEWGYFVDNYHLVLGTLGYGFALTVVLSLLLVSSASWLRGTVPLVMAWSAIFVMARLVAELLVGRNGLNLDVRWRLIDIWNDLYLMGAWCLGIDRNTMRPSPQPEFWEAAVFLGGVCLLCLIYLNRRIHAVEIVS